MPFVIVYSSPEGERYATASASSVIKMLLRREALRREGQDVSWQMRWENNPFMSAEDNDAERNAYDEKLKAALAEHYPLDESPKKRKRGRPPRGSAPTASTLAELAPHPVVEPNGAHVNGNGHRPGQRRS